LALCSTHFDIPILKQAKAEYARLQRFSTSVR